MTKKQLLKRLQELTDSLSGDMMQDMDIRNEIHEIEMELNNIKPSDSSFECEGCGS